MKISVNSTFSYVKFNLNYGSALQCYALQKYLKSRGHEATLLRDYRANPKYIIKRLKNLRYFSPFMAKTKAQIQLQKFIKKHIALSARGYLSYRSLVKHCPDVDCHIVGSDQVWHNANPSRYLTYAPDNALKLSYAASFGSNRISDQMKSAISAPLSRFNGITVREASGVDIVGEMGHQATHVLDPTLLLDWEEYPYCENNKNDYYYCYFLNLSDKKSVCYDAIKEYCGSQNKELLVTAPLNYPLFLQENLVFPAVEEWLGLYKNAECIFTNTYHGLLFCLIFKKQFVFFQQQGKTSAENERFASLLSMLELTDRVVSDVDAKTIEEKVKDTIDYDRVYKIIREKREITNQFFAQFSM